MVSSPDAFASLVQEYASGARGLPGPASPAGTAEPLAARAARLAILSRDLSRQLVERLDAPDAPVRAAASIQLLAKALVDFQVSAFLLQSAEAEGVAPAPVSPAERAALYQRELEANLRLVQGGVPAVAAAEAAAIPVPASDGEARAQLARAISSTLTSIEQSAARSAETALTRLLGMGMSTTAQAAELVGANIAQVVGAAEKVGPLDITARQFFVTAFNALVALLGPDLTRLAASQVIGWVNEIVKGKKFARLLQDFYQTSRTADGLALALHDRPVPVSLDNTAYALQELAALDRQYQQQVAVIDRMLLFLRFLPSVSPAALPQAQQLRAAASIILTGYIIYSGADFVDAPTLEKLDRIPGPPQIFDLLIAPMAGPPPPMPVPTVKDVQPMPPPAQPQAAPVETDLGELLGAPATRDDRGKTHAKPPLRESPPPETGAEPVPIEEKIRLDLAVPSAPVVVGEPFEIAVAIRMPQSAKLALEGLDKVTSGAGTVYREKPGELVRYRVKVSAPGCDIETPEILFLLPAGRDSDPRFFLLTPRKAGPIPIIVTAYQETDLSVAQSRVQLQAVLESVSPAPVSRDEARAALVDDLSSQSAAAATPPGGELLVTPSPEQQKQRQRLYSALNGYYSLDELQDICYRLDVDWDNLKGDTKYIKAGELIEYFLRRGQLDVLYQDVKAARPKLNLP